MTLDEIPTRTITTTSVDFNALAAMLDERDLMLPYQAITQDIRRGLMKCGQSVSITRALVKEEGHPMRYVTLMRKVV